jgi:hypothetical protein
VSENMTEYSKITESNNSLTVLKNKTDLVFIAGVEGSGTTLLNKLISESKNAMSITHHDYLQAEKVSMPDNGMRIPGVNHVRNFQHFTTVKKFNRLVNKIWQFPYSNNQDKKSQTLMRLCNLKIPVSIYNVVIKRSYPSGTQGIIFPNLADLFCMSKNVKIIHLKRNLKKNASSVLRRGFVNTIEDSIERVKHANRLLESQLDLLENAEILTITYEDLLENKHNTLAKIENFLGCEPGELKRLSFWIGRGSIESRHVLEDNQARLEKDL